MKKVLKVLLLAVGSLFSLIVLAGVLGVLASNSDTAREVASSVAAVHEPVNGITMANYSRIKDGMTYAEVVAILGQEGQEMSSNNIAGIKTVMYQWKGRALANMNAMFQNGELIQKAQFGLQ